MSDQSTAIDPNQLREPSSASSFSLKTAGFVILAAFVYFCVARLSLLLAYAQSNTSAVWPASGLAIGGLVVFGIRFWPAVTAGVLALTLSINPQGIGSAAFIATGNTLEAVVGATLINQFADGRNCLRGAPTVFRFIVGAALLAPLLSAISGVVGLVLFESLPWSSFGEIFFTWYTGNAAGILVFAPMVILWSTSRTRWSRDQILEGLAVLLVLVLVGQAICGIYLPFGLERWPSAYLVIPVLLWAAFRLGRRGTVAALIVLTAIAVAGTVRGFEVFPDPYTGNMNLSLLYLQIFLSVVAAMSLVVAGLVSELRRATESLEQKVATRTRRLEEMVQEKDDLMAIAAHDLQAPLAGMRNLLQLVRSRPETLTSGAAEGALQEMEKTSDGMLNLVSSLLVAKRAEEVGMSLTYAPCDAVELVTRMVGLHRPAAASKGIEIRFEAPDEMPVTTHPESFSQIASNLISNAVKYSPEEARVDVLLRTDGNRKRRKPIVLEVRDQGPGIAPEEVERIFDKFHRADNQPTGGERSHGIGLYIVDKLIVALGGSVSYSDAAGGGSVFTATVPTA